MFVVKYRWLLLPEKTALNCLQEAGVVQNTNLWGSDLIEVLKGAASQRVLLSKELLKSSDPEQVKIKLRHF